MQYDAEILLEQLKNWSDPYPKPILDTVDGMTVVRDDLLVYGAKIRYIDHYVKEIAKEEIVFGGANKVGWGPTSLTFVCRKYGKKATFFMAKRATPTVQQQMVLDLGGVIHWVPNGMLPVTTARAREYQQQDPENRDILPLGLEHWSVLGSIVKIARSLPINPEEIWTVGSSGTLNRGLQLAFPMAESNVVQVGHSMNEREIGRAKLYKCSLKFDQEAKIKPPYPSAPCYDAKVWEFVQKYASKKETTLIYNVA